MKPGERDVKNLDSQDKPTLPPLELWLVDDDEHFRRLCVELLEQTKAVQCAQQFGSAEGVIAALRKQPGPETILLDVSMPGLNGAAAVKTIKSLSPGTAVFMFSTLVDPEREAEARAGGASGYLHKSESVEVVVKTLQAAVHPPTAAASV